MRETQQQLEAFMLAAKRVLDEKGGRDQIVRIPDLAQELKTTDNQIYDLATTAFNQSEPWVVFEHSQKGFRITAEGLKQIEEFQQSKLLRSARKLTETYKWVADFKAMVIAVFGSIVTLALLVKGCGRH